VGYIVALLILFLGGLLGKVVVSYLQLKQTKHTLVYGLFAYFAGFFILSGPFTFFHLHWNLYFIVMTLYHFVLIGLIFYMLYKKRITIACSRETLLQYLKDNYLVLGMSIFYIFMNFASNNTLAGGASGDDVYYLSRAVKNIGGPIYPIGVNLVTGEVGNFDVLSLVSFLELYWGYMQQALQIDLIVFVRTSMAIVSYVWFFYTFDEVIYVLTDKQQYERFKYTILSVGLLYYVNGMEDEAYKFMYHPWFGNVFSLMMYIPLLLIFLRHSLTNKKGLYLLGSLPFIATGFSPVSVLHAGISMFPAALLWSQQKTYQVKQEKRILASIFIVAVIFLTVSSFPYWAGIRGAIGVPGALGELIRWSEMDLVQISLKRRFMFMLPGIVLFFYRLARKEVRAFEKYVVLFGLGIVLSVNIPLLNRVLFILFNFVYRRVIESYMLAFVFYSAAMLLLCLRKVKLPQLLGLSIICSLIFYGTSGFYFVGSPLFKRYFNIHNLLVEKRVDPAIRGLESLLLKQTDGITNVCAWEGREEITLNNNEQYIDVALAATMVPNAYYNCFAPAAGTGHLYFVTKEPEKMLADVGREHLQFVDKVETDNLTLEVYEFVQ